MSIRVENIPHTSTEYYNIPTPDPEGYIENVLSNMPSESRLHNVHTALIKMHPRMPSGTHRLTVTKHCKNLSLSVCLQQDARCTAQSTQAPQVKPNSCVYSLTI